MSRHVPGVVEYKLTDGSVRYRVRLFHNGRRYKWSGFLYKNEAKDFYADRKRELRLGQAIAGRVELAQAGSVAELIERYLAKATNKRNYQGEQNYGRFWTQWLGELRPDQLTPDRIDAGRAQLLKHGHCKRPLTHATVNRYVHWLHHVLQMEVDADRLEKNPCRLFVKSQRHGGQKFEEPKAPEEEFTIDEEVAIARQLGPYADVPTLAILTGLREEELFRLRWVDLDFARGRGRLPTTKGKETQYFPLGRAALALFRKRKATAENSPWVFPHPKQPLQPVNGASWYSHVFKPAARRAGIVLDRKAGKTFHTLRHTFASRLQDQGADVDTIKAAGRWKTWRAMERYLKRKDARVAAFVDKLGALAPNWSLPESDEVCQSSETPP